MCGACSTLPPARCTVAVRLGARQIGCWQGPHAQPPSQQCHWPPFFSQRLATASACTHRLQPPCHMKLPAGTPWPARTVILSPRESSSLLTGATQLQLRPHLSAAVPSVRKRSIVVARHVDFSRRDTSTSGAAVLIQDVRTAALLLETCRLWRRFARKTKRNTDRSGGTQVHSTPTFGLLSGVR